MPRSCSVCSSKHRKAIEKAVVQGRSNRAIAAQYGLSASAVFRHHCHVATALAKAAEARQIDLGSTLLDRLAALQTDFRRLAEKAEATGEWPSAIVAARELRETLKLIGELQSQARGGKKLEVHVVFDEHPALLAHEEKSKAMQAAYVRPTPEPADPQADPSHLLPEDKEKIN
jgi:hypothetical protein